MVSIVQKLKVACTFFARASNRGALTEVARQQSVSRPVAYRIVGRVRDAFRRGGPADELGRVRGELRQAEQRLQDAHQVIGDLRRRLEPDWARIHAFIVEAAVAAVPLRKIKRLVRRAFGVRVSHEYARTVVNGASVRARQVFEKLTPERKARRAVADEIFLGDRPMLVVAEPQSLAVLRVSVEAHRDEKTWAKILQPLEGIEIFASDLGKGLTAAVEARGWPHQADVFHAVRILTESWAVEERHAYEAIEEEYAWERRLQKLRAEGGDSRGVATNHTLARKKTQRALERFAEIERLSQQMRSAIELCDPVGRWMTPEDRQQRLTQAMTRLEELGLARRRRVAGYWRNPKLLTFAREVQKRLDALQIPPGPLAPREIIDAAVAAWALARGLLRPRGALTASLRAFAASRAHPDFPALGERVASILDDTLRASSAIECLNSLWRVYQQVKKTFGTDFAYLVALHHNMHRFEEGRRRGRTPFELLGIDPGTDDWLSLIL
jgi:hypothetical protein